MFAAVVRRAEECAFVVDLRFKAENLISAAVGQHETGPVHEPVEAAHLLDQVCARSQHQVIGVSQDDLGFEVCKVVTGQRLNCGTSPYWHETRCLDRASGRRDRAGAGDPTCRRNFEREHQPSPPSLERLSRETIMASPKERNR